jgi:hypothetical protein
MDSGMKETAGMAVSALVQILVRRLQIEIGDGVLEHQDRDSGEGKDREFRHLLYFGLGSQTRKASDAKMTAPTMRA